MRVRDLFTDFVYTNQTALQQRMWHIDRTLNAPSPQLQWLRLNMVTTLTGALHDEATISDGLSNTTDRVLMSILTNDIDVIFVGAATVRQEHFGLIDGLPLAVLSSSGVVFIDNPGEGALLVLTPPNVALTTNVTKATHITLEQHTLERLGPAAAGIAALRSNGFNRILCEGGAHVATALFEQSAVDELCLTLSLATGGDGSWSSPQLTQHWRPVSMLLDEEFNALYLRCVRKDT